MMGFNKEWWVINGEWWDLIGNDGRLNGYDEYWIVN